MIPTSVVEPVLPMSDIQGIAVPGFLKPYQTLIGVRFPQDRADRRRFKAFLRHFAEKVSSAAVTLADRRHRRVKQGRTIDKPPAAAILQAVAFSFPGLRKLSVSLKPFRARRFNSAWLLVRHC